MKNPFKDLSPEEKIKARNRMLWTFCITVFVIGMFWAIHCFRYPPEEIPVNNYTFFLEGENMSSIMICENEWHYELIDSFIPCVVNKTVGGIGGETIDWTLSPQENCHLVGGEFTGLNIMNETRAKELYDQLLPKCFEFKEEDISYEWLNTSLCYCEGKNYFEPNCDRYLCGEELMVIKK
jgi:hypothetical protein